MKTYWANFVKTGDPNNARYDFAMFVSFRPSNDLLPPWPQFNGQGNQGTWQSGRSGQSADPVADAAGAARTARAASVQQLQDRPFLHDLGAAAHLQQRQ